MRAACAANETYKRFVPQGDILAHRVQPSFRRSGFIAFGIAAFSIGVASAQPGKKPDDLGPLTLPSTRSINFTTDEGTWISLDLSPDGKTIVFELLGDLYTLPITGGAAKPLTTGMAYDSQPRYSPDGKKLVFISDRDGADNLWITDADGSHAYSLTKDRRTDWISPEWTPDGRFILAERGSDVFGGRELWMYDVNGGAGIQITKASPAPKTPGDRQANVAGAVSSPDGKYIYYSRRNGLFGYNAKFPLWQIVRRNTSNGMEDVITADEGSAIRPRISPDGRWLVYGTREDVKTGLRARDLNTGAEHWVRYGIDRDDQEGIGARDLLPGYAFTPDSTSIVLSYGGHIRQLEIASGSATDIPFTAEVKQLLGPLVRSVHRVEEGPVVARIASDPRLSPDGQQVAFSSLAHLFVAPVSGAPPRRLTQSADAEFQPTWSPDGKSIAYVTWDALNGGAIWKIASDGSGAPTPVSSIPGYYRQPVWSLDGTQIFAIRSSINARRERRLEIEFNPDEVLVGDDIIRMPASGGAMQTVAPARGASRPQFTTMADRLFVTTPKGLVSMRFDGSDLQELVVFKGKDIQGKNDPVVARDVVISPDHAAVIALINHQVWLFKVPQVGGSAVEVDISKPSILGKRLTVDGADSLTWSPKGDEILWTIGATLFRLPLTRVQNAIAANLVPPVPTTALTPPMDAAKQAEALKPAELALHVEEPRLVPDGSVVLRGATVITMKGDEVLQHADIVITGDRIMGVGPQGKVSVPAGAKVLNVAGKTIMPGIVDAHAHFTPIRRGLLELNSWPMEANLAYGVTATRDPQAFTPDIFAYQDLADTGRVLGPRAYSTGGGIFSENDFHSLDDARRVIERYTKYYRTHLLKSYEVGNRQQRQWMVQASLELHAMPTTEGGIDTKMDMSQVIDGFTGNEHNLPQTPLYKDIVQLQAQSGTSYTPTLVVAYGGPTATEYFVEHTDFFGDSKLRHFTPPLILHMDAEREQWVRDPEYIFPEQAADAAKILRAGGLVALGGHGQMQGIQCHWEMWAFAMGGMTPLEVIRVATINGAKAIGLDQDIGSLETGKLADLIVLDKSPLRDIHNTNSVHWVMRGGVAYEGATLNEIYPKTIVHPESWWQKDDEARTASAK